MKHLKNVYRQEMNKSEILLKEMDWKNPQVYGTWLKQTHNFVCHSTRIIVMTGAHFPYDKNQYHLSSIKHVAEENHHETLLEKDIQNLKLKIEDLPNTVASKIMYQNQFYWIQHMNPISVYGYYLFLEGLAVEFGPWIYSNLKEKFPENCCNFLRVHANEDPHHIEEHFETLSNTTESEQKLIAENLVQSSFTYCKMMEEIAALTMSKPNKKIA